MKWIMVFILLFVPLSLSAEIHGYLELGKGINNDWAMVKTEIQWWVGNGDVKNELYGGWETWMNFRVGLGNNRPFTSMYTIGDRFHYKNMYVGIESFCIHPIWSSSNVAHWNEIKSTYQGGMVTTFIGVEW